MSAVFCGRTEGPAADGGEISCGGRGGGAAGNDGASRLGPAGAWRLPATPSRDRRSNAARLPSVVRSGRCGHVRRQRRRVPLPPVVRPGRHRRVGFPNLPGLRLPLPTAQRRTPQLFAGREGAGGAPSCGRSATNRLPTPARGADTTRIHSLPRAGSPFPNSVPLGPVGRLGVVDGPGVTSHVPMVMDSGSGRKVATFATRFDDAKKGQSRWCPRSHLR